MLPPARHGAVRPLSASVVFLVSIVLLSACAAPEPAGPTDEELIDAAIEKSTSSYDARQFDEMLTVYAEDFRLNEDMGKESYREFLAELEADGNLEGTEVDLSGVEISVDGESARVDGVVFRAPGYALDMTLRLEKLDGQWLFVEQTNVTREREQPAPTSEEGADTEGGEGEPEAADEG